PAGTCHRPPVDLRRPPGAGQPQRPRRRIRFCRITGIACPYSYAPSCMWLTVAAIVNSALPFVSGGRRTMLLCLVKAPRYVRGLNFCGCGNDAVVRAGRVADKTDIPGA